MEMETQFLEAFDKLADPLFRHCFFRLHHREQAKDVVQESFAKTWEYLADGGTIDNIRAFLYRVATNLIIDGSRKKKVLSLEAMQEEHAFDPVGEDPRSHVYDRFESREAVRLLELLDEDYRTPILMRFIDDMSPKEIGRILNESENAVSVRIHRGLQKLRTIIQARPQ